MDHGQVLIRPGRHTPGPVPSVNDDLEPVVGTHTGDPAEVVIVFVVAHLGVEGEAGADWSLTHSHVYRKEVSVNLL